jgi:tRNA(Arg) A34 adenosine deaminase TadA
MSRELKYLKYLEKVAIAIDSSTITRARLAACLVYKNEILSIGVNKLKSHPFQLKFSRHEDSIYLHAENDCIKNALKIVDTDILSKCTMYICRVKYHDSFRKTFMWGLSKPCSGCMRAIATFDIAKVVYTCDDGNYKYL